MSNSQSQDKSTKKYRTRNRKWCAEDDRRLTQLVAQYGYNWSYIGAQFYDKFGKSCRQRWINQLDPSINRSPWTQEQEWTLYLGVTFFGTRWCQISCMFNNRPDKHIKNYWNTSTMKRKAQQFRQKIQEIFLIKGFEQIRSKKETFL